MKTNVVFLDFDGVCVHKDYHPSLLMKNGIIIGGQNVEDFDPRTIHWLRLLLEEANAKIVIHSSWVYIDSPEFIKQKLISAGVPEEYIHQDYIAKAESKSKSDAIYWWLVEHYYMTEIHGVEYLSDEHAKNIIILDDEKLDSYAGDLWFPQVQVRGGWFKGGLRGQHIRQALNHFGGLNEGSNL